MTYINCDWASKQYLRRPRNYSLIALVFWVCVVSFVAGWLGWQL